MKILQKGTMPNGTKIQIEDWSKDYNFKFYSSTLASYPISKTNHKGSFAPKEGKLYRFAFDFKTEEEAKNAFNSLIKGNKSLLDYKEYLNRKEYINCI